MSGRGYLVEFDLVLNSGTAPFYDIRGTLTGTPASVEGWQLATAGANVFEFECDVTTTGVCSFINNSAAGDFETTNISVREVL